MVKTTRETSPLTTSLLRPLAVEVRALKIEISFGFDNFDM